LTREIKQTKECELYGLFFENPSNKAKLNFTCKKDFKKYDFKNINDFMIIYLVGISCVGKTTIVKILYYKK